MASRAIHAPLATVLATIPSLPRPMLARLVQRMIDRLDDMDGDSDVEENGDEHDVAYRNETRGCLDPGGEEDDEADYRDAPFAANEDDEEDDPAEIDDEPEEDDCAGGIAFHSTLPLYGVDQSKGPTNEQEAHEALIAEQARREEAAARAWSNVTTLRPLS